MNPTFLQGLPCSFTLASSIYLYIHFSYILFLYTIFTSAFPVAPFFVPDPTNYFLDYHEIVFFRYPQGFHMALSCLYSKITVPQRPSLATLLRLTIIFSFFILIFLANINHYDQLDICLL